MDRFLNQIICGDCLEVMKDIPDKGCEIFWHLQENSSFHRRRKYPGVDAV